MKTLLQICGMILPRYYLIYVSNVFSREIEIRKRFCML